MKSKVTENPGKAIKVAPSPGEGGGGFLSTMT